MIENDEWERAWKEEGVTHFEAVSQTCLEGLTGSNEEKCD
jgi:hypothetical protein